MKLGCFMMPLHSLNMSYADMYAMDMEAALYAEKMGYDELWMGEHYSAKVEPVSDTLQFMSWLIPQTERIKLCTGVLNLPQHHPAKVAADVALFDHMSKGRFIMGIGPGGLASDFELFQTTDKDRQAMMVESRFFGGLEMGEIAALLDVSEATILRDWRAAKAWLAHELRRV